MYLCCIEQRHIHVILVYQQWNLGAAQYHALLPCLALGLLASLALSIFIF